MALELNSPMERSFAGGFFLGSSLATPLLASGPVSARHDDPEHSHSRVVSPRYIER